MCELLETSQIVFEEFGFQSMHAAPAPVFSMRRMAQINPGLPANQAGAGEDDDWAHISYAVCACRCVIICSTLLFQTCAEGSSK